MNNIVFIFILVISIFLPFQSLIVMFVNSEYINYWKEIIIGITAYMACLGLFINKKKLNILFDKINLFVFIFIIIVFFLAILHPNLLSLRGFLAYVLYAIVYFILITHMNIQHMNLMLNIFLFGGFILGVGTILQMFFSPHLFGLTKVAFLPGGETIRAGSLMGHASIILGWYLALLFPLALALFVFTSSKHFFIIYLIITIIILIGIIFSFSRSAYLQVITSIISFFLINRYKLKLRIAKHIVIISLILVVFLIFGGNFLSDNNISPEIVFERFYSSFNIEGENIRITRWKTTLSFIFSGINVVIGAGPGAGWQFSTFDTVKTSPLLEKIAGVTPGDPSPESFFLLVIAELGIFGLIAFIFFYLKFILLGFRQIDYFKDKNIKFAVICSGITAGLIGLFVILCVATTLTVWPVIFLFWFYCAFVEILNLEYMKKS